MKRSSHFSIVLALGFHFLFGANSPANAVDCPEPAGECPRPIQLGVSGINVTGACSAGTLGALMDLGVAKVIVSNNHVLANENAGVKGEDPIVQPGTLDNSPSCAKKGPVGVLVHFIPIDFSGGTNLFDIAFAVTDPTLVDFSGEIARIGLVSTTPFPGLPAIGTPVKKHGRTTGLTFGEIAAVNVTALVAYSSGTALFQNQYRITPSAFSSAGDSGSLIVEDTATCARAVGLLFAGSVTSTIANPLNQLLEFTGFNIVGDSTCWVGPTAQTAPDSAMSRAIAVQSRHESGLLATAGVTGVGIGRDNETGKPTLEVYVESAAASVRFALPSELEGVPVRVLETGEFVAF